MCVAEGWSCETCSQVDAAIDVATRSSAIKASTRGKHNREYGMSQGDVLTFDEGNEAKTIFDECMRCVPQKRSPRALRLLTSLSHFNANYPVNLRKRWGWE